jgi:hypothetical protein
LEAIAGMITRTIPVFKPSFAVRHGIELPLEQFGLRPGFPGMRHALFGIRRPSGDGVVVQSDAGRKNEAVIGKRGTAGQYDLALVPVDRLCQILRQGDAGKGGDLPIAVLKDLQRLKTAEIEIGIIAGGSGLQWLDQRNIEIGFT